MSLRRPFGGAALVLGLALAALTLTTQAWAAPTFPPLTGRVVDDAHVLSAQTQAELTDELATLEAKTGHQLVVVTLPSLQGYEIEDYGYQLGRTWAIGQKGKDDGALLIVAPNERKVRVEVGYGLEPVLTDALSSVILQTQVLPKFRAGDMQGGIVAGAQALIQQLSLPEDEAKAKVAQAKTQPRPQASPFGVVIVLVIVFWVLSSFAGAVGGRRRGGSAWWLLPLILSSSGRRDGWGGGGFGGGFGGGGGFSGGGGSFGGGGASGGW